MRKRLIPDGFVPFPEDMAASYRAAGYWQDLTLGDILDRAVAAHGQKVAIVDGERRITYDEFGKQATRLALWFLELGIGYGDFVTVALPNCAEILYVYYGLAKVGAAGVMALPQHRTREIAYLANHTESVALITPSSFRKFDYLPMVEEVRGLAPTLKQAIIWGGGAPPGMQDLDAALDEPWEERRDPRALEAFQPHPDNIGVMVTSGGTTGDPKCVPRTHNDYICNSYYYLEVQQRTSESIYHCITPMAHNAALISSGTGSVLFGETIVMQRIFNPEETLETMQRERITCSLWVPTQVVACLNSGNADRFRFEWQPHIGVGGAYLLPELARGMYEEFNVVVINTFGMAEGPVVCTWRGDPMEYHYDTVGRPVCPGSETLIVDDDDRPVPQGVSGELIERGPHTPRGYYRNDEENRRSYNAEGFMHSGDYAMIDGDGNCRITGRKKDMIIRGGENISANEIESLIVDHPMVQDVAIVAMPDVKFGEKVCAYIIPQGKARPSLDDITEHLRDQKIASFKLPERLELVERFPLTNVGKVSKAELRDDIAKKLADE